MHSVYTCIATLQHCVPFQTHAASLRDPRDRRSKGGGRGACRFNTCIITSNMSQLSDSLGGWASRHAGPPAATVLRAVLRPFLTAPPALFRPCLRPSERVLAVPFRQNRLQRRSSVLETVLTGRNGSGRARIVANRAGTALTGAVRTGPQSADRSEVTSPGPAGTTSVKPNSS